MQAEYVQLSDYVFCIVLTFEPYLCFKYSEIKINIKDKKQTLKTNTNRNKCM